MRIYNSEVRVRYSETDQMSYAYYGNYLTWFEVARTDYLRDLGFSYKELEEKGLRLAVMECKIRYYSPAHYDDLLTIETKVIRAKRLKVEFEYKIYNSRGDFLAEGSTLLGSIDENGEPNPLPQEIIELITPDS